MKRTYNHLKSRSIKLGLCAIPAAALMLGASHAQSTIGLNFQGWYYDSGATPQTVGYGAGYQTTGFPVTAKAFGITPANWSNTDPLPASSISTSITFGGTLTAQVTAPNAWESGIGELNAGFNASPALPETVPPGNDEVTWAYLDDGNVNGQSPSVSISGLAAQFPNGYVIQTIAANSGVKTYNPVDITDGVTTNTVDYSTYYVANIPGADTSGGTVGLSAQSGTFTSDTINVNCEPKTTGNRSTLAAIIITDQPVVSEDPQSSTNNQGSDLVLSAAAIGIQPLSYQWQHNGTNLPGATASSYTNSSLAVGDGGNYDLVVTNLYGSTTSSVAAVTVVQIPSLSLDLPASVTNYPTLNTVFFVVAGGAQPLGYIWKKNGVALANTGASLNLTNLQASDAANYSVIVTNVFGSVTSTVSALVVLSSQPPYEGFNYSPGDVNGQNGGTGWSGAWSQPAGANGGNAVMQPGVTYSPSVSTLVASGGALQTAATGTPDCEDNRSLLCTLGGSGTLYFSFVAQFTNSGWEGIELMQDGTPVTFLGQGWYNAPWGFGSFPYPEVEAPSSKPSTVLSLLVYRFDFTATNTTVREYVNPSSLISEPATPDATGTLNYVLKFDQLQVKAHQYPIAASPSGVIDELRFGGSWSAVVPYVARTSPPFTVQMVTGGVIKDTKPAGTLHPGANRGTTWLASSTDSSSVTRTGVEQFSEAASTQITVAPDPDFNTTNGTIAFWMQYNLQSALPGPGAEGAMLFDRRTTSGTVIVLNIAGGIEFQAAGGARFTGNDYVVDGNWHHIAVTYDQAAGGTVSLYVDGALDTATTNTGAWSWPTNQEIELGRSHDPYWYIYDAQMDDLRIYNRILTPTEVSTIATQATSDTLVDTNALKLRFNFDGDSALYGNSLVWPYGTLESSPALGAGAVWTPVTNAVSPQPILLSSPAAFYRLYGTP